MHLEINQSGIPGQASIVDVSRNLPSPALYIDREEVEEMTGASGGPEVFQVDVINADGNTARFFLSLSIKRGRARAMITAMTNQGETRKDVTADWRL